MRAEGAETPVIGYRKRVYGIHCMDFIKQALGACFIFRNEKDSFGARSQQ